MITPRLLKDENDSARVIGVEDLRSRDGCAAFYFLHGPGDWVTTAITRNWLWPTTGDVYKWWLTYPMVHKGLIHKEKTGEWVALPRRLDFVSTGYQFTRELKPNLECVVSPVGPTKDHPAIKEPTEDIRERLDTILESLHDIFTNSRTIQVSWGGQTMRIGNQETFRAMALNGLYDTESEFLYTVLASRDREHLEIKAVAQYAFGALVFQRSRLLRRSLSSLNDELSVLLGSVILADAFGHVEHSLDCYKNIINLCIQTTLSPDQADAPDKPLWLLRCADALDEVLNIESALKLAQPGKHSTEAALRKLKHLAIAGHRKDSSRILPTDRWRANLGPES
jgi:hypothetical protein